MSALLLALLTACDFSAPVGASNPTDTAAPSDPGTEGDDTGAESDDTGTEGDDTGRDDPDPQGVDDDGDGYSEEDGDCDDGDVTIRPGAADGCDGLDEDCDGVVDEDAADEDEYEPNDASSEAHGLGEVSDKDPARAVQAALHNDADVDRFRFSFVDSSWDFDFTLGIALSSIPDGARYGLRVENLSTGASFETEGGASLRVEIEESLGEEQGGEYEVTIWAEAGAECGRRYLLSVDLE